MSQANKIFKVNGGDAFIEIGESYIRLGVGTETSLILEKNGISTDANKFNFQMAPNKVTYQGILNNIGMVGGLIPIGPKYSFNLEAIRAILNAIQGMRHISRAVSIGI